MSPDTSVGDESPWDSLSERLALIELKTHDIRGSGDSFFKSFSHKLCGIAEMHFKIYMAVIDHLDSYTKLYI